MKNKILFTTLLLMCLVCSISIVSAGEETQLTHGGRLTESTNIYSNLVTWSESATNGVHVYDLIAGKQIGVPEAFTGEDINVFGNKVVWAEYASEGNIFIYDIPTGNKTKIASNGDHPDIYGNYIVYDSDNIVRLYDLDTNIETQISSSINGSSRSPFIFGNKVVWLTTTQTGDNTFTDDVYLYDIPSHQTSKISTSGVANNPDIYENTVVWSETNNGKKDIFMRDIAANEITQVTTNGTSSKPAIYGNRIVYTNSYKSELGDIPDYGDVYMYEISSAKTSRITTSKLAAYPSIYGDKILYADSRADNEDSDIFLYDLSDATPAENYTFVTKWGSQGSGDGQFESPLGIAVDSYGNVFVTDGSGRLGESNNRIEKFDSSGNFITKWGSYGNGNGQFDFPYGVALDFSGNVYVAEPSNNRIDKFDSSGNFITKWGSYGNGNGQFNSPQGVAVDSSGNVYVVDSNNDRIQKFDSSGNYITKWGSQGQGNGQFFSPSFVTVDSSGDVYVSDSLNDHIQKFDSNGNFITKWGSYGDGNGQFLNPLGIAVDSSGDVYVVDGNNYRIEKFDSSGIFITKWGSQGERDGQFAIPTGIAIDASGNVYVTEAGNKRIEKFAQTKPVLPVANFTSNVIQGFVPLDVQFTDTSTGSPTAWAWDFGDGGESAEQNPTYTYSSAGTYTVKLEVHNAAGGQNATHVITVTEATQKPVASFTCDVTSGSTPLHVTFTDTSIGAPTAWSWTFGDGAHSYDRNPTHTYSSIGTYNVNLVVSNAKGTASTVTTITVESSSGDESSEKSSGGGSSGNDGGGAGGSPEPQSNVEGKELSQTFITSGNSVKFDFPQKATPVIYVTFDSKKTAGKTSTIVEMLKGKSALVSELPSEDVYKSLNIWVGNGGFGDSNNIENAVIYFMVEKSWVQSKNIDKSTITLNRYSDNTWSKLPTSPLSEDDNYLYFTTQTPGFSSFAITGRTEAIEAVNENQYEFNAQGLEQNTSSATNSGEISTKAPGFEVLYVILTLLAVFLRQRK